jgi:DNA polymerase (family 10)
LRENQGEIEAAAQGALPELVETGDLKGMIHVHSRYSDGGNTVEELARECIARGYTYLCLSDHSRTAFYAGGLTIEELEEQRREVTRLNEDLAPFRIFCGIESDILGDGSLDYPEEVLGELDFVIGSVHSNLRMDSDSATERLLAAVRNPHLSILGHPSGRLLLSREGYGYDEDRLFDALAESGIALEHNCNPHRLDPDWQSLRRAQERGIRISINPDAHDLSGFDDMKFGICMARKAWLTSGGVLNCLEPGEIDEYFRRRRA